MKPTEVDIGKGYLFRQLDGSYPQVFAGIVKEFSHNLVGVKITDSPSNRTAWFEMKRLKVLDSVDV